MPALAAIPWMGTAIAGAAGAGAAIYGANKTAGAQDRAAQLTTDAANRAAEINAKSAAEALAFSKAQAQNEYLNSEVARRGNYDQWAAGQRRLGTLGQMMGLGDREIPAYVAGVDPNFTGTSTPISVGSGRTAAAAAANGDLDVAQYGYKPGMSTAEMLAAADKVAGYGDRSGQLSQWENYNVQKDPVYFYKRMLGWQAGGKDVAPAGPYAGRSSGGSSASSAPSSVFRAPIPAGTTVGDYIASVIPSLQASALPMPTIRYQPGTLGAYMRV